MCPEMESDWVSTAPPLWMSHHKHIVGLSGHQRELCPNIVHHLLLSAFIQRNSHGLDAFLGFFLEPSCMIPVC